MQQWQPRRYRHRKQHRRLRWGRVLVALAGLAILLFGLVKLISYGVDLISSHRTSGTLQTIYYADPTQEPSAAPTSAFRRVISARRIREDESEEMLIKH